VLLRRITQETCKISFLNLFRMEKGLPLKLKTSRVLLGADWSHGPSPGSSGWQC
jgi:hypothetical protein